MNRKLMMIGVAVIALILLGQYIAYVSDRSDCSIYTDVDGSTVSYSVNTKYDTVLSEIHIDNHGDAPKRTVVLYDESYGSLGNYNDIRPTVYLLSHYLERCGYLSCETASVARVTEIVDSSLSTAQFDFTLIILNGSLPDTLYDGTSASKIVQWVSSGGHLCWSGPQFGRYIAHQDRVEEVPDYQSVCQDIFGIADLFNDDIENEFGYEKMNEELTDALKLTFNRTSYGIDMSKATDTLLLGYSDGTHASIGIMGYGSGQFTVFGGWLSFTFIYDAMSIAAFGITCKSELVSIHERNVTNGHSAGSFEDSVGMTHVITLSDLSSSRIWVFDRSEGRFV